MTEAHLAYLFFLVIQSMMGLSSLSKELHA